MGIQIAFDPGSRKTGYCVFQDGKPVEWDVIKPPWNAPDYLSRAFAVVDKCEEIIAVWQPHEVAVEDFPDIHKHNDEVSGPIKSKVSMMKCAGVQMMITWVAKHHGAKVSLISKGNITKRQSKQLAKAYGVEHKYDDPIDAFQIGICAGFDRKQR